MTSLENMNFSHRQALILVFRSSLYKLAYLNLFVSNGPQTICWINNYNSISWKVWGSGNNKLLFDQNLGFSKETGSKILNKKTKYC